MPMRVDFGSSTEVTPKPAPQPATGSPPTTPGAVNPQPESASALTFNNYIVNDLPYDLRLQLQGLATAASEPQRFYDPLTGWFRPGTVKAVIYTLLTNYGAKAGLGNWLIMARQRYPAGVQNLFADIVIADPNDRNHYIMIEASASLNPNDALSDTAKLAGFMDQDWNIRIEGYVFFVSKNKEEVGKCKEIINNYISENFDSKVTPVGTTP